MKTSNLTATVLATAAIIGTALIIGLAVLSPRQSDYINIGGQSEVTIRPDRTVLYFTVTTLEPTAQEAQEADTTATQSIQQALVAVGIDARNIQTSSYYLNKRVDWTENGSVDRGYELSHTLQVTTNVSEAAKAIQTAVGAGANGVDRVEFLITQEAKDAAVAEAMRQASVAAEQKAQAVTSSMAVHLGRVLKIEEGSWWIVPSSEPSDDASDIPAQYAGNVISPQRMAVQGNVNMAFAVN
jgi:hypothetical protein